MVLVMDIGEVVEFVTPFYKERDIMHNFSHIERICRKAVQIKQVMELAGDDEVLFMGCYFHGIIRKYNDEVRYFLQNSSIEKKRIEKIIQCALESHVQAIPVSLEGKIAHDAHLLEGGKYFMVAKTLVTGTLKGQSLKETVDFLEKNVINKGMCCFAQNQEELLLSQNVAREFIEEMKKIL